MVDIGTAATGTQGVGIPMGGAIPTSMTTGITMVLTRTAATKARITIPPQTVEP